MGSGDKQNREDQHCGTARESSISSGRMPAHETEVVVVTQTTRVGAEALT